LEPVVMSAPRESPGPSTIHDGAPLEEVDADALGAAEGAADAVAEGTAATTGGAEGLGGGGGGAVEGAVAAVVCVGGGAGLLHAASVARAARAKGTARARTRRVKSGTG
jgi:hypothetical protein